MAGDLRRAELAEVVAVAEQEVVDGSSPRSLRRRSLTELSERLFVIVEYPSLLGIPPRSASGGSAWVSVLRR